MRFINKHRKIHLTPDIYSTYSEFSFRTWILFNYDLTSFFKPYNIFLF